MEAWLIGILALLALLLCGLPIAVGMLLVGGIGVGLLLNPTAALAMLGQIAYQTGLNYELSVVPLFILMGNLIVQAGLADKLYAASQAWLGHRKGGLAMATVMACGGFSAVCGSSLATAATMAKVAMPPMRRYGYAPSLAAGTIAAGGTLGILIPPSVILVLYGVTTQQSIGELFLAGLVPGILGILLYLAAVRLTLFLQPEAGRAAERLPLADRLRALRGVGGVLVLFVVVIGGIYLGVFTATEAAGIGAFGAFVIALLRRALTLRSLYAVLIDTAATTAMMFFLLIGATMFTNFVNVAGLPRDLTAFIDGLDLGPVAVLAAILVIYVLLGTVLESLSMVLLTVPIFYPIVQGLGFDLVWFGILVVVVTEISLITPPIGLNVFVLNSVMKDVPMQAIFRGVVPFVLADLVRLAIILAFPALVLIIPRTMG
ncbi:TRAP transporter large permease [Lutibaculum baratangense]|uniref:TRAP transporter large permease protein n=1 Tax=Lutibaculum baratangense AMV1 TaxID=631454 RepID=V4RGR1_9HYPH|nr:TRAP transporter large permease [Lutibaculum baratangense]ESR25341.1 TRAP dicarboxylate transporter, DctM subunit, unknown substrate 3 [Lutibaculum baratangense AMV1]